MKLRSSLLSSTITAVLLLGSATPTAAAADGGGEGKISVELYYEAQCPGCRAVLTGSFREALGSEGFLDMADIALIPYGNAKEIPSDGSGDGDGGPYTYQCQHGPSECRYNAIEACGLSKIECPHSAFRFIYCIETYDEDRSPEQDYGLVLRSCAALAGGAARAASDEIESCFNGTEGAELMHQGAVLTASLDPPHKYVPWIVVDGVHDDDLQNAVSDSLLAYVCGAYEGPNRSPACANLPRDRDGYDVNHAAVGERLRSGFCPYLEGGEESAAALAAR